MTFALWFHRRQTCCFLLASCFLLSHTHAHASTHTHINDSPLQAWVQVLPLFELINAKSRQMSSLHVLLGSKCLSLTTNQTVLQEWKCVGSGSFRLCVCTRLCASVKVYEPGRCVGHQWPWYRRNWDKNRACRPLSSPFPSLFFSYTSNKLNPAFPKNIFLSVHLLPRISADTQWVKTSSNVLMTYKSTKVALWLKGCKFNPCNNQNCPESDFLIHHLMLNVNTSDKRFRKVPQPTFHFLLWLIAHQTSPPFTLPSLNSKLKTSHND